jgi:hypothetical protein
MKILIQWSLNEPADWEEYDHTLVGSLPHRAVPVGGEVIDSAPGWVHSINVQGCVFSGRDHYAIEELTDGVVVTMWDDDPEDHEPGMLHAHCRKISPPAFDERADDVNARQWLTIFGQDRWMEENYRKWEGVVTVSGPVILRPWSEFVPPAVSFHGIWLPDDLNERHRLAQSVRGWREWIE